MSAGQAGVGRRGLWSQVGVVGADVGDLRWKDS